MKHLNSSVFLKKRWWPPPTGSSHPPPESGINHHQSQAPPTDQPLQYQHQPDNIKVIVNVRFQRRLS